MDPHHIFCPNPDCPARGQLQRGNITVPSQAERRFNCSLCGQTFSLRKGTPFYRRRVASEVITQVLTLIAYGCPIPAFVAAFGFQARSVGRPASTERPGFARSKDRDLPLTHDQQKTCRTGSHQSPHGLSPADGWNASLSP
jgi:hypothetical protein